MSTKPQSFQQLIDSDTPVLVDFFATWCGPCKMMQPILEDTSKQMAGKLKILKVDVDKNPLTAKKFQVRGVPTLVLFEKGKILWRQSGVIQANQLVNVIKANLERKA